MKWLLLIFSIMRPFFGSSAKNHMAAPIADFKEMVKENAIKMAALFALTSTLATLFAAGIIIVAVDIGAQYDQNSDLYFSFMIVMGLTLSLSSLIIALIGANTIFDKNVKTEKREVLQSVGTSHPLQDAVALLIHDFVKEREMKRAKEETFASNIRTQRSPTSDDKHQSTADRPVH